MAESQDQSMEEILQSIKRIIADEGEAAPSAPAPAPFGSDVLELTDAIEETKPIDPIDAIMAMTPPAPPPASAQDDIDALMAMTPPPPPPPPPAPSSQSDIDALMSDTAVAASASALHQLMDSDSTAPFTPSGNMAFRSGHTVEDLVIEALRPMLKDWLDSNLPPMVERLVQREIARISKR